MRQAWQPSGSSQHDCRLASDSMYFLQAQKQHSELWHALLCTQDLNPDRLTVVRLDQKTNIPSQKMKEGKEKTTTGFEKGLEQETMALLILYFRPDHKVNIVHTTTCTNTQRRPGTYTTRILHATLYAVLCTIYYLDNKVSVCGQIRK